MRAKCCLLACLVLALLAAGHAGSQAPGQDKDKTPKPDGAAGAKERPATHEVKKAPLKIEVAVKGVFEAEEMTPVALRLEAWTPQGGGGPLTVQKAVEHGGRVRKGDTVVQLDLDRIDQAVRDLEAERHLAELAIRLAEKELPVLEQTTPIDLAAAERAKRVADEDLQKFLKEDRAFSEKSAEFMVKSARDYLDYAQEELNQLEKMYKANDLTEDTEKIILRRQRNYVERAAFSLKVAEKERDELLKLDLPRRDLALREAADKLGLALDKARATLPLTVNQKRLTLDKMKYDQAKTAERLARLKQDREAMTLKAPADGVVYYGRCVNGQWTTAAAMADKLQRGGQVQPDEILLTVVSPKKLFVRTEVEEKDFHQVKPGMAAKVVPTGLPDLKIAGKVESVSAIPITPGKFLARVAVESPGDGPVVAGMACSVKLVPYLKADALTVPASAVFADEADEDRHHVYVRGP
jgi:multidrug resistance efflux pump